MGATQDNLSEKALESSYVENDNANAQQQYVDTPRKQGFGSKVKRHCVRFWWLHILIFCIIFLIISLCLVYVGLPRIAQHDVDDSRLELTELQFLDPTSDSLVISQKAILHNPSKFTPTLDEFFADNYFVRNETGLYGPTPLLQLAMPEIHSLHPKSDAELVARRYTILSHDEVNAYVSATLKQEYVTSALVGKTKLHLGALPVTKINYNTTTTYKGLNGLAGFNVTDSRLNVTAAAGTPNLKGIAFIPNPSVITVAMGNVTLILSIEGVGVVGNSTINDLTLKPGDNHFPINSMVEIPKIAGALKEGFVTLEITGNSSIYNGQHLVYYEKALSANVLHLNLNVGQILRDSA